MSAFEGDEIGSDGNEALAYFTRRLRFETDGWDVHEALLSGAPGFTLVDVRDRTSYAAGHIPSAISAPYRDITPDWVSTFPADTLFVVYCAGPHCNSAHKAAVRLAGLGRPVKEMIGGITGWREDGFELVVEKPR